MAISDLNSALNGPMQFPYAYNPSESLRKIGAATDIESRGRIAGQELPRIAEAESAAFAEQLRAGQKAKVEGARAVAKAEREFAESTRKAREDFAAAEEPRPMFEPTQFNPAALSVGVGLIGLLLGFGGKGTARAALKSMKGFVEGAQTGQKEVYNRELQAFDQNLRSWKDNMASAENRLNRIIDQYGKDKNAALVEAKLLESELGEGMIAAQIRRQELIPARDSATNAKKAAETLQLEVAKATARQSGKAMPAAAQKDLEAKVGLRNTLSGLIKELDEKKYEPPAITKVLTAQGAQNVVELSRRAPNVFKDTAAFQNFMSRVERTNAPERHSLYGANLTRNELPRYNLTVPTYSDSGATIRKILQDRLDAVNESIALKQQIYARSGQEIDVAAVQPKDFVQSFSVIPAPPTAGQQRKAFDTEAEAHAAFARGEISNNQQITVGGKNARYRAD